MFRDADLSYTNLTNSDLAGSDCTRALFTNAILHGTILGSCIPCEADFSGADLTGAQLNGTFPNFWCETLFNPELPPTYDCDTIWTGTLYDQAAGGVDPQVDGWTLLGGPCALVVPYGTVAPLSSLQAVSQRPEIGEPFTVAFDDPTGTIPSGSIPVLLASLQPDPHFDDPLPPDGTLLPGYGLGGGPGELLVSLLPGHYLTAIAGPVPWVPGGGAVPLDVSVPSNPLVLGVQFYTQGAFVAPGSVELTSGLILTVGN